MLEIYLPCFLIILLLHYAVFLFIIRNGLKKLNYNVSQHISDEFISIIIPFRNESGNILNSLQSLTALDYPKNKFEVIYVNDSSVDDSLHKLSSAVKPGNVKVISVPQSFSLNAHKKRAVRFGIENSTGDIIFTTDADCIHQQGWLKQMMGCFDENTGFLSGPVEFYDNKSIWGSIQKTEFAGLVLAGAGLIGSGRPVICNAANIAYRRSAYEAVNGFKDNINISSGDDEFLMQKICRETNYKIKFCLNKEAVVKTDINKSVSQFYNQRKRWASKGLFYADKLLVLKLILIFLFYISLVLMPVITIFLSGKYLLIFILSVVIKFSLEYNILKTGSKILFTGSILKNFFLAEFLQVPYIIIAGAAGIFGNFTWKDRKLKR
ncbi:MAG: glycosyltransferase [Ignavibacteriaceae bacterium]|jgi:cellulose synthase/poly-beta-1,6-N-acetylglucosamine synthase-like glycosyltransferase